MKKMLLFIIVVIGIIGIFIYNYVKPREYEISYELGEFNVSERYDTTDQYYYFKITKDKYEYEYNLNLKYSSSRRLIKDILVSDKDSVKCIKPVIEGIKDLDYICFTGSMYVTKAIGLDEKSEKAKKINDYHNIEIYDKDKDFLVWNNKGFTNLNEKKDYNFLDKEAYDNPLCYIYKNYLIIADYDSERTFNKFYIYNNDTKKVSEFTFAFDINHDAYFMGDYDDYIYLFDKKNKVQYKIDIEKEKISKSSDSEGAFYYNLKDDTMPLNKLSYNTYTFNKDEQYNFKLDNNTLLMNYHNSKINIKVSNKEVSSILYQRDDTVYYLVKEDLYVYKVGSEEKLLLRNFEWNFSYLNKIYVFD